MYMSDAIAAHLKADTVVQTRKSSRAIAAVIRRNREDDNFQDMRREYDAALNET